MKQKRRVWTVLFAVCTVVAVFYLSRLNAPGIERASDSDIHAHQARADAQTASDRTFSPPRNITCAPFESGARVEDPVKDNPRPIDDTTERLNGQKTELAYIQRLRRLAVDDPDSALALAEQAEESFPDGEFSEERQAIAINVLVRLDRIGEARSRTRAFIRRYPKGRFTRQVRRLTGVHPRPAGPNREWEW